MSKTDGELALQALEGDRQAFEELVHRYQRLVHNIVYHYLGFSDEVEDIAQEVFLKVYRNLDRFDQAKQMKSWIAKIATNCCYDELRRRKSSRVTLLADMSDQDHDLACRLYATSQSGNPITSETSDECLSLLAKAMETLSEKDRMAFVLRELESMEYSELAEAMNASEVAIRIRVSRARKKLQEELGRLLA